jgi:hypothetical protein
MATQNYFLQNPLNGGGNAYATVKGFPAVGAQIYSQPYNGGPAQQWIPAQYPGNDPTNQGGVVCVLYTADEPGLVMTAGPCQQPTTLQKFQQGNRYQLWAYPGTNGQGTWVNCGTGCVLDLSGGNVNGGLVQTWSNVNNNNQQWALQLDTQAKATADAAPALETAGAD